MVGRRKKVKVKKKGTKELERNFDILKKELGPFAREWAKPATRDALKITVGELRNIAKKKNKIEIEIVDLGNKRKEAYENLLSRGKKLMLKPYPSAKNIDELRKIEKDLRQEVGGLKSQVYMIDFRKDEERQKRVKEQGREKKFAKKIDKEKKEFEKVESELRKHVPYGFKPPREELSGKGPAERVKAYNRMTKLYKHMLKEAKRVGPKKFWVKFYSRQPLTRSQRARQEQIQSELLDEIRKKEKTLNVYKKGLSNKMGSEIVKRKGKEYGIKGLTLAKVSKNLPFSVRVEVMREALTAYDKKINELRMVKKRRLEKELEATGKIITDFEKKMEEAEERKIKKRKKEGAKIRVGGKELLKKEKLERLKREKKSEGLALKNLKKGISEAEVKEKNEILKIRWQELQNLFTTKTFRGIIETKDKERIKAQVREIRKGIAELEEEAAYAGIRPNLFEWQDRAATELDEVRGSVIRSNLIKTSPSLQVELEHFRQELAQQKARRKELKKEIKSKGKLEKEIAKITKEEAKVAAAEAKTAEAEARAAEKAAAREAARPKPAAKPERERPTVARPPIARRITTTAPKAGEDVHEKYLRLFSRPIKKRKKAEV